MGWAKSAPKDMLPSTLSHHCRPIIRWNPGQTVQHPDSTVAPPTYTEALSPTLHLRTPTPERTKDHTARFRYKSVCHARAGPVGRPLIPLWTSTDPSRDHRKLSANRTHKQGAAFTPKDLNQQQDSAIETHRSMSQHNHSLIKHPTTPLKP